MYKTATFFFALLYYKMIHKKSMSSVIVLSLAQGVNKEGKNQVKHPTQKDASVLL